MRVATFKFGDVEISLSQFPGDVGGVLANANRWRAQVGLPPITSAQLPEQVTAFRNNGFSGQTLRIKGPDKQMLGAIISEPAANRTWFVKAVTTSAEADKLEPSFIEFAHSFKSPG